MDNISATAWHVLGTMIQHRLTQSEASPCTADELAKYCNSTGELTGLPTLDKATVHKALAELIRNGLVQVQETMGTFRYRDLSASGLGLLPPQQALFASLLTNPPLSAGELLKVVYRIYPFRSETRIVATIDELRNKRRFPLARHWPPGDDGQPRFTHANYKPSTQQEAKQTASSNPIPDPADELERKISELESLIDALSPKK